MLKTILGIFGRSPFASLQSHIKIVKECVDLLPGLFHAIKLKDYAQVEAIANKISDFEHQADLTKNHIRNHLPKNLYLPIDRQHVLDILSIQDDIADEAQDVGVLATLKHLVILPSFEVEFEKFLVKNIEAFHEAKLIIDDLSELLESSFGGLEAQKVRQMIDKVATMEHEVDIIQRKLLKKFYESENEITYTTFFLWQKIFAAIGAISNLSEKMSNRVRLTLEHK